MEEFEEDFRPVRGRISRQDFDDDESFEEEDDWEVSAFEEGCDSADYD